MANPKKTVLTVAGSTSLKLNASKTLLKYKVYETSPFRFSTIAEPIRATVSPEITSNGSIKVTANIRVTTKYLNGFVPEISIASICSVTRIEPSSAPIPEPILPAQIRAIITGPISLTIDILIIEGIQASAPKSAKVGRD